MEKGKGKPPAGGDNYDTVNMEMSDDSDNEMFACKEEYQAFKQHFDKKSKGSKENKDNEYGGGPDTVSGPNLGIEYGSGPAAKFGAGNSEYGGGSTHVSGGSTEYGGGNTEYGGGNYSAPAAAGASGHQMRGSGFGYQHRGAGAYHSGYPRRSPSPPQPTPAKIEREPKLYKDSDKDVARKSKSRERNRSKERRRSRSGERHKRTRSRSRGSRRSRSRDRRRSRSRDRGDRRDDWRRGSGLGGGRGGGGGFDRRGGGRCDRRWNESSVRMEHRKNVEEQLKKVEEMGLEMPKYYKPGAVNPASYAEQMQKRKMLWKKPEKSGEEAGPVQQVVAKPVETVKPAVVSFNKWEATNFGSDEANEKFRRLMGIRAPLKPEELAGVEAPGRDAEKIMTDLEKNYEQARVQTHKARGVGLGFGEGGFLHHAERPAAGAPPQPWNLQAGGGPPPAVGRGGHINFVKKSC